MSDVNPPKPLTYRQQQAQATRERIVSAARHLFADLSYAQTSVDAIATQAGVAVRTVYAAFGTKKAILAAVCAAWLIEADIQPLVQRAQQHPDAHQKLALAAQWTRQQYERGADVIAIFEGAARDDAEMAVIVSGWLAEKNALMARFIQSLAPHLPPSVDITTANALFLALTSFDLYRQLVVQSGWSVDRYQHWLTETLRHQLLHPNATECARTP